MYVGRTEQSWTAPPSSPTRQTTVPAHLLQCSQTQNKNVVLFRSVGLVAEHRSFLECVCACVHVSCAVSPALDSMEMMMQRPRLSSQDSSYEDEDRVPQQIHVSTRKEDREREKNLQKKLGELQTQTQRLERRISLLRTENETLRLKEDNQRPLEEKIKSLKKRNAELAAIARRLEEKAKALQQENSKSKVKSSSQDEGSPEIEHLKRGMARQRAKDLADHAKSMLAKDKEIEELRRKCQELADQLSNGEIMVPQNAEHFEEKEELVNIIKQSAKERIQLEQQLANIKGKEKVPLRDEAAILRERAASDAQRSQLEEANQTLNKELEKLEQALVKAKVVEHDLNEKTVECSALTQELGQTKQRNQDLQQKVSSISTENVRLTEEVVGLQDKVKDVAKISEECSTLKTSLSVAQKEREAAQDEVKHLNLRVNSLENLVRDLQESAEAVKSWENAHQLAVSELQEKQREIEQLQQIKLEEGHSHTQTVSELNARLRELEERRKEEEERREQLSREVQRLHEESKEQHLNQAAVGNYQVLDTTRPEDIVVAESIVPVSNHPVLEANIKRAAGVGEAEEEGDESARREESKPDMDKKTLNQNDRPMGESFLSAWAQKGPIQVYIAKYNYDPFEFSPNESPEAELPLTAGDYVLVVGEMDEDGFFDGELIDGRQGLVPSNFIERVEDEDLAEFHVALMQAGHRDYSNNSNNTASTTSSTGSLPAPTAVGLSNNNHLSGNTHDLDFNSSEEQPKLELQNGATTHIEESNSDLEDIAEIDEDTVSVNSRVLANGATAGSLPPCPRSLSLDRQLSNSLLISWKGPDVSPGLEVQSYHVLVDGQLKTSVKSIERTKALLEGISANNVHRVCVRCLSNRGQSRDAQCTMLVGTDVYPTPSELKLSHVSPTSASLSWIPGNSNYQHAIMINGKEVRVVKPGVFRHTLTGLTPGALHQVTLIAKSISGVLNEEKSRKWVENVSASVELTTPQAGAPEPPLNVQVECGPREGTLVLTWLPVTINSSGMSNGVLVSGYQVIVDGRRGKLVSGATSDHVVLSSEDYRGALPATFTVRTLSTSGVESVDSDTAQLPPTLASVSDMTDSTGSVGKSLKSSGSEEHKGHDTDEEIEAAFREASVIGEKESSPIPAPRKPGKASGETDLKEFHSQKPAGDGNILATPTRVVPAIEITRDSGNELGPSLEEEAAGEVQAPSPDYDMNSSGNTSRVQDAAISSHYRGDGKNPSAFRQVDQSKKGDRGKMGSDKVGSVHSTDGKSSKTSREYANSPKSPPGGHESGSDRSSHGSSGVRQKTNQSPRSGTTCSPDHRKHVAASSEVANLADEVGDNDSISGEINPVVNENSVRLFVALFDYDPVTMSPNVDSIDEELPFREGQILKVFGDKDPDGFYKGESEGRTGYIPCNMVSEVQIDDLDLVEQLLKETTDLSTSVKHPAPSIPSAHAGITSSDQLTPNGVVRVPREGPVQKMIAMYDYDPQELSPNVDAELELSFKTGDHVLIYGEMDEDGFFSGQINGQHGLVPSNFLQPAPTSDDEGLESASVVSTARSRSGESIDATLKALGQSELTNNFPQVNEQSISGPSESSPSKKASNKNVKENNQTDTPASASPAEEEKPKKKGGFLNKSRNILKKLTR